MSLILRGFSALNQKLIEIGAIGSTLIPNRVYSSVNALFEAVTGGATIGAGIPLVLPHDHGKFGGGAPIPRGCIFSFDNGDNQTAWKKSFAAPTATWERMQTDRDFDFMAYVSTGIDTDELSVAGAGAKCYLSGWILADASATGAELRLYNKTRVSSQTSSAISISSGTTIAWYQVTDIPCAGGRDNKLDLQARFSSASSGDYVRVYACSLYETRQISQPESSGVYVYSSTPRPS